uniref:hypothetical protein n=1 Tax=Haemophilus influenzae TaxID=727 RepID=UPI001952B619
MLHRPAWGRASDRAKRNKAAEKGRFAGLACRLPVSITGHQGEISMWSRFRPAVMTGTILAGTVLALAGTLLISTSALAQEKVLRIGMTAADIPRTHGQPDQGFEGNRFTGIPMY